MEHFQWVDGFFLLFIVLGIVYGIQNGLLEEVAEIFQIMLVIAITHSFYKNVAYALKSWFSFVPEKYMPAIGFLLLGISVWILLATTFKYFGRHFHVKTSKVLKIAGGGFLGAVHLLIIFSFLSQAIILFPLREAKKAYNEGVSYTGYYLAKVSPSIYKMFSEPLKVFRGESEAGTKPGS